MTKPQRVVLVLGAAALLLVLLTTDAYQHGPNGEILSAGKYHALANVWDWQAALVRAVLVSGASAALYFAVGSRKP